ncbi:DNA-binding protein [Mannheimia haemolytica]
MKEWYTLKELLDVGGLPSTPQGIILYAKRDKWRRRRVAGVKGNIFEYYVYDMPKIVQQSLGIPEEQLLFQQELVNDNQKEHEKFLNKILSDIKKVLINNNICNSAENQAISNEEKTLIHYYRKSTEQNKATILNTVIAISKSPED